jgi:hypothetical protein
MKKYFLASISLTTFSLSIILFQFSCQKTVDAQAPNSAPSQQNKIIYEKYDNELGDSEGIWISNYDGTAQAKINISIPGQPDARFMSPKISPDGKTIFFRVAGEVSGRNSYWIYSANIDGTNVKQIFNASGRYDYEIGDAY